MFKNKDDIIMRYEYLFKIKKFDPFHAGSGYGSGLCFGSEKEFFHCHDFKCGIGDYSYWIDSELEKLSEYQLQKLLYVLDRNKWIKDKIIIHQLITEFARDIQCETHHIYRMGERACYELIKCKCQSWVKFNNFPILPEVHEITEEHINNIDLNLSYKESLEIQKRDQYSWGNGSFKNKTTEELL